ncbi:MAG: penicillin-binding transpeptidase domain-containing protein [Acidaminococcaceae bacterium]
MSHGFGTNNGKKRIFMLGAFILLLILGVVSRLFYLQIIQGSELSRRAMEKIAGVAVDLSPRGSILDRNGEDLAVSVLAKSLYVDPLGMNDSPWDWENEKIPQRDPRKLAAELMAPILKMPVEVLYADFKQELQYLWLKRTLEPSEVEALSKVIKDNKLHGFHFVDESKRYYTNGSLAAQILGYVGTDDKGLGGIELVLDKVLKGQKIKYDAIFNNGHLFGTSLVKEDNAPKMSKVYLTLDSKMQYVLEKGLDDAMAKTHAASATVILMDPHTGEILGMASRPTFDPNHFGDYPAASWVNRAVSVLYEPGSVFKPIVGSAGLTEGVVTPDTPFNDTGAFAVADRVIQNWDGEGLGAITFTDIIKYSVNTGMADLGMKLGGKRMTEYAKKFGFGTATGIELPGEEDGILYNAEEMRAPDVATMAIGQGVAVSPLQMLRAICAIANGGELVKPYIIKKVVAADGKVLQEGKTEVVRRVITEDVASKMRVMMEKVISEGGGKTAKIQGYRIAGKTGTAEKLSPEGGYAAGKYIASFVGFVPSDEPQYAMLIMLDTPQGAFYGSQVSAPVFRDTLQQILVAQGIQPSNARGLPSMELLKEEEAAKVVRVMPQMQILSDGRVKLPNLAGLNVRQVAELIQQGQLSLIPHGGGTARRQSVPPGVLLPPGSIIEVWFE